MDCRSCQHYRRDVRQDDDHKEGVVVPMCALAGEKRDEGYILIPSWVSVCKFYEERPHAKPRWR
jgi:hypothetical protein